MYKLLNAVIKQLSYQVKEIPIEKQIVNKYLVGVHYGILVTAISAINIINKYNI